MTPLSISVLAFLAVASITMGAIAAARRSTLDELATENEAFTPPQLTDDAPLLVRILAVFSYRMVGQVTVFKGLVERMAERDKVQDKLIAQAGRPWGITSRDLDVISVAGTVGLGAGAAVLAMVMGEPWVLGLAVGVALGLYPRAVISRKARARSVEIRRSLPAMLDLLVMAAEAGATPQGGLEFVAREMPGPLGDEVRVLVRHLEVSVDDVEAFHLLAERTQVEEVEEFVSALVTATRFSRMSFEDALDAQAARLRSDIELETQAQVRKLTVKVLLPLVVFFLPAVLIILVGPALGSLHGML